MKMNESMILVFLLIEKNESMILVFTHKEDICFSSSCNPVTPFANYSG